MIQPTELKIGNWLLLDGVPHKVGAIDLDLGDENVPLVTFIKNGSFTDTVELNYGRVERIPLTPEMLKSLNFEESGEPFRLNIAEGLFLDVFIEGYARLVKRYNQRNNTIEIDNKGEFVWIIDLPGEFKYLHRLQNLVLDITGEELHMDYPSIA